jgi:enoyl-CoA hydratase
LTGAGDKAFVAGADIVEISAFSREQAAAFVQLGHRTFSLLESLHCPTLAAVNGFCLGGGLELALSCDLIYASEQAKFGLPEVGLGIMPGFGGTQRLPRKIGPMRAKELIFTGEKVTAQRAKELGLTLEVLPADKLLSHCREVALEIGQKSPFAVQQSKRAIDQGMDSSLGAGNELERQAFSALFGSEDQREGIRSFLEKRLPVFRGQ